MELTDISNDIFSGDNFSKALMPNIFFEWSEAVVWRCSVKKVFLEISQNSQ